MRSMDFLLEARKRSLLLPGTGQAGESPTAHFLPSPLITSKAQRAIHELLALVRTFAHPAEWKRISAEVRLRMAKKAIIESAETTNIPWHHPWMLPEGEDADDYVTLGEYLDRWRR
ncbi:MAG: hypothetical protein Q7R85_04585 [bacterium]|nr:hypothetical protein [bacterium]